MSYTVEFIIMAVLFSMVVGGFMALCIVNMIAEDSKPVVKWIMGIIIAVAIGCGISGLVTLQNKGDDEYYYTCDNCGHTIVIHGLRER